MSKSILVTGANGFVGRHLCRYLASEGNRVVGLVRENFKGVPIYPGLFWVGADCRDQQAMRAVVADHEVSEVYHLAAQSIVRTCAEDPVNCLDIAVVGTASVLEAVRLSGRAHEIRVVVSTSDKVYGKSPPPYTEETPLDANNAYEVSKACQDLTARMYATHYGMNVTVIRASNIYGPGDQNLSRLIPRTIHNLKLGQKPVVVEGSETMLRQYLYVADMVDALMLCCRHGAAGQAYCVAGSAVKTPVQVITEVCNLMGVEPLYNVAPRPAGLKEIQNQFIDDTLIKKLGHQTKFSFEDGLRTTVAEMHELGVSHAS